MPPRPPVAHFFAGAPAPGGTVELEGDDARHAVRSLRMSPGDRLTSSDGEGAVALCRVVEVARDRLVAEAEERSVETPGTPRLAVLLAPPKGDRLAWAVQKLTEVGVDEIVLLEARRSVRVWRGDRAPRARERARGVAREAAKQARRSFLPRVDGPVGWDPALRRAVAAGPTVVLWEAATRALEELLPSEPTGTVSVVVGPEGGIPEEDAERAADAGAVLASLGANVLRTETAALVAAAVALSRYGRLGQRG